MVNCDTSYQSNKAGHRKLQKIRKVGSRIALVIFPFEQKGSQHIEVEDMILGYLIESKQFKVKEDMKESPFSDMNAAKRLAQEPKADFILMGKVVAKEKSLEIS